MFAVDRLVLLGAVLILVGIASSKFSARLGLPVLVLFMGVGMLAGSEGIGGIHFENYALAHGIGTLALAVILFDGGLRTSPKILRMALAPALSLATGGVLVTAVITGVAAGWILELSLLQGLLLGSILASTDAAAVFSVLRGRGVNLSERLEATLEVESGSNDPMAVFLTVGLIQVLQGEATLGPDLLVLFVVQMAGGALVGFGVGRGASWVINRVNLTAAGLYPVLAAAIGLLAYGLAASLGASGFLSVYLAGIVLGGRRLVFQRGILLFHDGAAWLSQIAMFVLLGLLVFPSRLWQVVPAGLLLAAVLILVARPVAVALLLPWFGFRLRELILVSWVGLKGAVPIVLATFPLLLGLEGGEEIFDVVFFAVLVSAVLQGWSLPLTARLLGLNLPPEPQPPVTLEITSLKDVDGDIVEYTVTPDSRAAGRPVRELALPDGAVVAMIARDQRIIPPRGTTRVDAGDHVFLVLRPDVRVLVDRVFAPGGAALPELPLRIEFPLRGDTTLAELEEFYGIRLEPGGSTTLDQALRDRLGGGLHPGAAVPFGNAMVSVREVVGGCVEQAGLALSPLPDPRDDGPGQSSI